MQKIINFLAPYNEKNGENPEWFFKYGRLLISLVILSVPIAYDHTVAEVAGDIRWYILHISMLTMLVMFFTAMYTQGLACDGSTASAKGDAYSTGKGGRSVYTVKNIGNKLCQIPTKLPFTAWLALFLAIWGAATIIWSINPIRTWWFGKHFLAYIGLFGFIFLLRDARWYRNLLWILAAGVGFNSLIGILQFYDLANSTIFAYFRQSAPPAGTLSNKNLAASYLVLLLPILFYLFISSRQKFLRILSAIFLTLGGIFLFYTRSRGSWIAFVCGLIFLALWLIINKGDRQALAKQFTKKVTLAFAIILAVTIGLGQFTSPLKGYHSIDKSVANQVDSIINLTGDEISTRIAYNFNGWKILKDYPFGVGIGAFHTIYPAYYAAAYPTPRLGYSVIARPQRMHNDIGQAFVEMGWPGGIAFVLMFGGILVMVWRLSKCEGHEDGKLGSLFIMVGIVGFGVNSLGDFPMQMPTGPALLWALTGMLTGQYVLNIKDSRISLFGIKKLPYHNSLNVILVMACVASLVFIIDDDMKRRKADNYLKFAMSLSRAHNFGDDALQFVDESQKIYPNNSRTHEYLGVIYANHPGNNKFRISLDRKIAMLEYILRYDIYAPNNLVNLAGLYNKKAEIYMRFNQVKEADIYLDKAIKVYSRLLVVADFAFQPYIVGGMTYLLKGKSMIAMSLFEKSLEIKPNNRPAMLGKKQAETMLKLQGKYESYLQAKRGFKVMVPRQ